MDKSLGWLRKKCTDPRDHGQLSNGGISGLGQFRVVAGVRELEANALDLA